MASLEIYTHTEIGLTEYTERRSSVVGGKKGKKKTLT